MRRRTTPEHSQMAIDKSDLYSSDANASEYPLRRSSGLLLGLLAASIVAVFFLITLGGVVRVTDSGLGCPDWPLCHGQIIPPLEFKTLIEYSHRLAASLTSILIVTTAAVTWWRYRESKPVVWATTLAVGLLGVEVILGGITVLTELPPTIVTVHLATAETIFALLLLAIIWTRQRGVPKDGGNHPIYGWAIIAALVSFAVIMSGSYMVGRGAGTICPSWPLCDGGLFPSLPLEWVHMAHRLLAGIGGILIIWLAIKAWQWRRDSAAMGATGVVVGALVITQTVMGAANPWSGFAAWARAAHLSIATGLWGGMVVMTALAWNGQWQNSPGRWGSALKTVSDYLTLTKPMIIVLLLITAMGGMFLAAQGVPPLSTALLVMLGGSLGAGGANALNHFFDRDIDMRMRRTQVRPLPGNRIPPRNALVFGVVLNVLAFGVLALFVNLLSALLTLSATLFYVLVYTLWLKRSTPQNIVIGGAAGAVPPMVGWAAITGGLELPALYLFALVFFWTPPHFWALSLLLKNDYARAGIPMLPVVRGVPETARSILLHSLILVSVSILFVTIQTVGWIYATGAVGLGAILLYLAWRLLRMESIKAARHLYLYSLLYLTLLFVFVMVDSSVPV